MTEQLVEQVDTMPLAEVLAGWRPGWYAVSSDMSLQLRQHSDSSMPLVGTTGGPGMIRRLTSADRRECLRHGWYNVAAAVLCAGLALVADGFAHVAYAAGVGWGSCLAVLWFGLAREAE